MGYLFLKTVAKSFLNSFQNSLFFLPILTVFGFCLHSLMMLIFGLISLPLRLFANLLPLTSFIFILIRGIYSRRSLIQLLKRTKNIFFSIDSFLPLFFFTFPVIYFSIVAERMVWPPPGDPAHLGTLASLLLMNNRVPLSLSPLSTATFNIWQYPPLFIVSTVFTTLLTGIYPGQSMLLLGAFFSAMIPSLIASVVYIATNSYRLTASSFFLSFVIPGFQCILGFRDLLFSNLINGTYPTHLANLLMILLFAWGVLYQRPRVSPLDPTILVLGITISLVYYPYATFVLAFLLWKTISHIYRRRWWTLFVCLSAFAVTGVAAIFFRRNMPPFMIRLIDDYLIRMPLGYRIQSNMLSIVYLFFIIINLVIITLLYRYKGGEVKTMLFVTFLFLFPTLLSLNDFVFESLYMILWVFPTRRCWPAFFGISLVYFHFGLSLLKKRLTSKDILRPFNMSISILLALSVLLFYGSIANLDVGRWQRPVGEDYLALEWLVKNTEIDDLILNDRSYLGLYLTSFRAQNVINELMLISEAFGQGPTIIDYGYVNRSLVVNQIFDHPEDYALIRALLTKYEIKYVHIGSEPLYLDFWHPVKEGGIYSFDWRSRLKNFTSNNDYLSLYDENPCLRAVFIGKQSRVYRVIEP